MKLTRLSAAPDWFRGYLVGGAASCPRRHGSDAGGVGLNLQYASVVVNMDLPWNPAVLEQRIGRVHRLGQRRPVRVVNFVAQGRSTRACCPFSSSVERQARRKLLYLHRARTLADLNAPPGNRLEALKGERRICFTWRDGDAHDVEIVDYH